MPRAKKLPFENVGELLERLGNIPGRRVCLDPRPGTATKRDLLDRHVRGVKLYELIDGTLVEKPMGSPESFVAAKLIGRLERFLEDHDLGYVYAPDGLIELDAGQVRGPDVCFTPWDARPDRTVPRRPISREIPTLAAEVLSPRNTVAEIERKLKEYFFAGVRLVWVIDPRTETAVAYDASDSSADIPAGGDLDGKDVLPGFRLPLAKLFERLEPPAGARKGKPKGR